MGTGEKSNITYGDKLAVLTSEEFEYRLPYDKWPKELQEEWKAICKFNTAPTATKGLNRNTSRRQSTVEIKQQMFESFFGYCMLSKKDEDRRMRGEGLNREDLYFALITDAEMVKRYLEFRKVRFSQYTEIETIVITFNGLTNPKTGYIAQNVEFARRISQPKKSHPFFTDEYEDKRTQYKEIPLSDYWKEWCRVNRTDLRNYLKQLMSTSGRKKMSRPFVEEGVAQSLS